MSKGLYFMSDLASLLNGDSDSPDEIGKDETYKVNIPIFREGRFEHRWYGELDFDRSYLEGLVANHKAGVYAQKVSFDVSHEPDNGAIAWVEDIENGLYIEEKIFSTPFGSKSLAVLYARAELNKRGYELLKNKEFRYFSSEIHPDYSTNEKHEMGGNHGDIVVRHGPTLIGGGLTNRPFIPGLGQIELSATSNGNALENKFSEREPIEGSFLFMRGLEKPEPVKVETIKNSVPVEPELIKNSEPVAPVTEGECMKFSELMQEIEKFNTPKEQIDYMNSVRGTVAAEDAAVFGVLLKAKEQVAQASAQADDAIQRKLAAEAEAFSAKAANTKLSNDLAEAKEGSWQNQVKLYCDGLHKEKHHVSAINAVEKILLSMKKDHREYKFSVVDGEDTKDLQILDLFSAVFSSLPSSARLDESEETNANPHVEVHPNAPIENAAPVVALSEPAPEVDAEVQTRIQKFTKNHGYAPASGIVSKIDEDGYIAF